MKGGRTECYIHKLKIDTNNFCIRGFDLTSLYPSMMLLHLPLRDSVIIDGGDEIFIENLVSYSQTINGNAEERLK